MLLYRGKKGLAYCCQSRHIQWPPPTAIRQTGFNSLGSEVTAGAQRHLQRIGGAGGQQVLGKPVGSDLREGKVTLPLIYTLERASAAERASFLDDACRDNPFRLRLSGSGARNIAAGGLAQLRAARRTGRRPSQRFLPALPMETCS